MTFTKEQLQHIIETDHVQCGDASALARMALAGMEAKLDSADKLQDSAFRHGLQHGFSLGQTDNQAGFEECLSSYGTGKGE